MLKSLVKLAGVSAVLSAGLVTAFDAGPAVSQGTVKVYHERVAAEPARPLVLAQTAPAVIAKVASDATVGPSNCQAQTWPYLAGDCVTAVHGSTARKPVRTITLERRDVPNTSTLVRVPVAN